MASNASNQISDRNLFRFLGVSAAASVIGAGVGIYFGLHLPSSLPVSHIGQFAWTGFLAANIVVWSGGALLGIASWALPASIEPSVTTGEQLTRDLENAISPEAGETANTTETKTKERELELAA